MKKILNCKMIGTYKKREGNKNYLINQLDQSNYSEEKKFVRHSP